jgi:RNA methyltransferase, TrmH family
MVRKVMTTIIKSLQHPLIKHLVKLRKNSDYRHEHHSAFIEGAKLVAELCPLVQPKLIVTCREELIPKNFDKKNSIFVTEEVFKKISGLLAPEGIAAEVPLPQSKPLHDVRYLVVLDRINDPGNLGTLLRSALAFGWEGAFIVDGSCDPFNEKALRSSKGATFKIPLAMGNWKTLEDIITKNQLQLLAADPHGIPIEDFQPSAGLALVLSNEAQGLSKEAKRTCEKVSIPMIGPMESLNVSVAGGILLYKLKSV